MNKRHRLAIELKYEGKKYADIAEAVNVHEKTVGAWFYKSGKLYDAYKQYAEEEGKIRREEALDIFRKNIKNAAVILSSLMAERDPRVKFKAAKEIIDRELGRAVEKVETKHDFGDKVSEVKVEIVKDGNEDTQPEGN